MTGIEPGSPVLVIWLDSHEFGGWRTLAAWRDGVGPALMECETVGYLLVDEPEYLLIAQSRGTRFEPGDDRPKALADVNWADTILIPRAAVRAIDRLGRI